GGEGLHGRLGDRPAVGEGPHGWAPVAPLLVVVPIGLLAAVVLRLLAPPPVRPFTDRWPVTEPAVQALALLAAGVAALAVFGTVALLRRRVASAAEVGGGR
ncbi:hypothetical protein, partial [Dactylosporangium fulvum]|uniref:hypothetical protein n=1 Tax=Dactylosporangium fulvum TaxID=53359 RepID=UPI0031D4E0EF